MSHIKRPYIPISVRVQVAERQFWCDRGFWPIRATTSKPDKRRLEWVLEMLFDSPPQLDHDPALILRKFNKRTGKYTPDANDPEFLIYREKADHQQKTTGRKPGALKTVTGRGSDAWLAAKFRRLEGKNKPKKKRVWPKRKFAKVRHATAR